MIDLSVLLSILLCSFRLSAQVQPDSISDNIISVIPSFPPKFVDGGDEGLKKYISTHVKYPKEARKKNKSGLVLVKFSIDTAGNLTNVMVRKSSGHPLLDEEAIRVVSSTNGKWIPGTLDGKLIIVDYILPVRFTLK